jgi:glutathione reductase (NADPH)
MPPLDKHRAEEIGEYDAFYIGGGSGGIASAVSSWFIEI